jgi:hypothetical protein
MWATARRGVMENDTYFERALAEYREQTEDGREFADLPDDEQHTIIHRAQELRQYSEREKRG